MKSLNKKRSYTGKYKTRTVLANNIKQLRLWKKLFPSERTLEALASVFKTEVFLLFKPGKIKTVKNNIRKHI